MELRTEHMVDCLRVTREEAITTSNLLADIRDLLDERLPSGVDHPGGQANELNNTDEGAGEPITVHDDEPADEALAQALFEAFWRTEYPYDEPSEEWLRVARAARKHIADWRADEVERLLAANRDILAVNRDLMVRAETAEADLARAEQNAAEHQASRWVAEDERDEWEAKFDQTDSLLARTRDERDKAEARCERLSALAEKGERHAALRADVEACRNACQIEDILARDDERGQS